MIQELFLPKKFQGKRLLAERIVGLHIGENAVSFARVQATPAGSFVEQVGEQPLEESTGGSFEERAQKALGRLLAEVGSYDKIRIAIPAALVVFKELSLPFTEPSKIRMVLDYEIETQLPFPLEEAVLDFIITKKTEQGSQILVAAVREQDLSEILDLYHKIPLEPDEISVDLFGIYDLYLQIPAYRDIKDGSALVDIGNYSSRISFLQDGQLRLIRNTQKGIQTLVRGISEEAGISEETAYEALRYGSSPNDVAAAVNNQLMTFFTDVQFTLNSFSLKAEFYKPINKILFTGRAIHIHKLEGIGNDIVQTPCEFFATEKIFENRAIQNKISKPPAAWEPLTVALGAALPTLDHDSFDLRRKFFALPKEGLMRKQLHAAIALFCFAFLGIGAFGYWNISSLTSRASFVEERELKKLKRRLKEDYATTEDRDIATYLRKIQNTHDLKTFNKNFRLLLDEEDKTWLGLAKRRLNALEMLLDVTKHADRKTYSISIADVALRTEDDKPIIEFSGLLTAASADEEWATWTKFEQSLEYKAGQRFLYYLKDRNDSNPEPPEGEGATGVKFSLILRKK